ncbi:trafficking protein particle complex subunit 10 [Plakobranchus ocellatus]|uniref:Trafficking protein particle complex subunit 10 n=1 Tax=Plakobranchus ocellatus TaxID=259542 RepID=A0AAV3YM51_9GAST|nr:trafficking protein particle complex subunit 10 [Plakobranchus ocellatus]
MAASTSSSQVKVSSENPKYSKAVLLEAMKSVKDGQLSLNKASKIFGIPYATLGDKIRGRRPVDPTPKLLLTSAEEEHLATWIKEMARRGFGKTQSEIKDVVKQMLDRRNAKTRTPDNRPSKQWMASYFKRHPDTIVKTARSLVKEEQRLLTAANLQLWFSHMKTYMDNQDPSLLLSPDRLYSADDTNFSLCPKSQKLIADNTSEVVYNTISNTRTNITVHACVSAAGHYLPPLIIYPYKRMPQSDVLDGFDGAIMSHSRKGCITAEIFLSWLEEVFVPAVSDKKKPVALFLDGHASSTSLIEISEVCAQNEIVLYCLISHTSHSQLCQPLDQAFFGAIKSAWENEARRFMSIHGESVTAKTFASVLKKAWDATATAENAVSGFIKSGLFPFNPSKVCSSEKLAPSLTSTDQTSSESATAMSEQPSVSETLASPPAETEVSRNAALRFTDRPADRLEALKDLTSMTAEWGPITTEKMWTAYNAKSPQCDRDFHRLVTLVLAETPSAPSNAVTNRDKPCATLEGDMLKLPNFPKAPATQKKTFISSGINTVSSEEDGQELRTEGEKEQVIQDEKKGRVERQENKRIRKEEKKRRKEREGKSHGNQALFSSLHAAVSNGLPKESCQWRRSYGRAPRSVHLSASFVPYDADILPEEEEKTLVSRPYFHIYWTDCDMETYKQSGKDDIAEWHAALKARNIPDWLIVVVTGDDSRVKTKLLQRASVADKVKSDFCGKHTDRCIVLTEPNKLDSKSSESWSLFFQRLRTLLLEAFNRHLNKYEEGMRSRREKRNEPRWNYFSYFIVQEELAFMFEMLGLKEDALIQYDELDAMFDQFVENFASGETVQWLTPLIEPCTNWAGLSLSKPLDLDLRQQIKLNSASLLSFRNYLFSRQAALLFQMGRAWETAMRAMDYLYNTVVEVKLLEIEAPTGAMSCWVILSCLEVLHACDLHSPGQLDERFALYTANLWDFARKKLRELGQLCSLMPGLVPTSEQLSLVVDLVSGMVLSSESLCATDQSPVDKLRESLSSPSSFKKHYLEMCEQAMGTYKYISRFRSARLIGMELAEFYMKVNKPDKAENFLLDSIRMYQQEGWHRLADGTMVKLAQCQQLLEDADKYLKTSCHIACSQHVSEAERALYFQEMLMCLNKIHEDTIEMRASQAIFLEQIQLDSVSASLNDNITLTVIVNSNFPEAIMFDLIEISFSKCSEAEFQDYEVRQTATQQSASTPQRGNLHRRQPSGTHITLDKMSNFQPVTKTLPAAIDFQTYTERTKGRLVSCGTVCDRAHELLSRSDSSSSTGSPAPLFKGDYSKCFKLEEVTLKPGANALSFTTKVTEKGTFSLSQICLTVKCLELLKPLTSEAVYFKVISISPEFTLKPKHSSDFILGIEQEAELSFTSGSLNLRNPSSVAVTTSPFFSVTPSPVQLNSSDDAENSRERDREAEEDKDVSKEKQDIPQGREAGLTRGGMILAPMKAGSCQTMPVRVCMNMRREAEQDLISKVSVSVEGWQQTFHGDVKFVHPFQTCHKVYTSGKQKYFQIVISGTASMAHFTLTEPHLESPACRDVDLVLLNPPHQVLQVNQHQSVSLLWMLEANLSSLPSLDLSFSCQYSSSLDTTNSSITSSTDPGTASSTSTQLQPRVYHYSCSIHDFQTHYILSYGVSSIEEDKACTVGETAILDIKVKQLTDLDLSEGVKLAYTVKANGSIWAIGGKSSGFFTLKEGKHSIVLDVVPMQAGQLFFPLVTLYKCMDQVEDASQSEDESPESDDNDSSPLHGRSARPGREREGSLSQLPYRLLEFSEGQVFNESRSRQINVRPCASNSDIDVSLVR